MTTMSPLAPPRWDQMTEAELENAVETALAISGDESAHPRARFAAWVRTHDVIKEKSRRLLAEMIRRGWEKSE